MPRLLRSNANTPMFCTTCLESKPGAAFPSANPTEACDHVIKTCTSCLDTWIQTQLDNSYQPHLTCPECDEQILAIRDLKERPLTHRRYCERYARIMRGRTPGLRWCFEEGCRKGRVHENINKREQEFEDKERKRKVRFVQDEDEGLPPVAEIQLSDSDSPSPYIDIVDDEPEPDIYTCHGIDCPGQACATCDRPWHEGETCSEFAWRNMGHLVEDALSRKVIEWLRREGRIKDCPNCACPIEREGPGLQVYCTRCLFRFCWDET